MRKTANPLGIDIVQSVSGIHLQFLLISGFCSGHQTLVFPVKFCAVFRICIAPGMQFNILGAYFSACLDLIFFRINEQANPNSGVSNLFNSITHYI